MSRVQIKTCPIVPFNFPKSIQSPMKICFVFVIAPLKKIVLPHQPINP